MYTLTASDFADTGQWRLLLEIGEKGLRAWLENTLHKDVELQEICKVKWHSAPDSLRANIEEAVYNHPRLLDDFATKIVLYDPRTLFLPTSVAEAQADAETEIFNEVYKAKGPDVMSDRDGEITALWSPGPGVKNFLSRTFPGARITCHLLEAVRQLRKSNPLPALFIRAREDEADFIFLDGEALISASTHPVVSALDIEQIQKNIFEAYGVKEEEAEVVYQKK